MSELNDNNIQNQKPESTGAETVTENVQPEVTPAQPAYAGAEVISGVEPVKKKGITAVIVTILIILAVLVGGSAAAYNFVPAVKNNVKMLLNDPEDYYAWVENENMEDTADDISKAYGNLTAKSESYMEIKANLESAAISALIEQNAGVSLAESGIKIPGEISIVSNSKMIDAVTSGSAKLTADGKDIVTANVYLKDGKYYYQIPELSSSYIAIDIATLLETSAQQSGSSEVEALTPFIEKFANGNAIQEFLTDDELNELLVKYFDIIFSNIDDVDLEKGVKCKVNGVEMKYNELTADINEGTLYSIIKDVLKEAKKDKTIIKLVESTGAMTADEYKQAVEGLLDELGGYNVSGGDSIAKMVVYVDGKGDIQGREIKIPDADDVKINYLKAKDGSDEAFEVNFFTATDEGISVIGDFEEKSDKRTGDIKVSAVGEDGFEFNVHVNNFKVENEEKGYVSGEVIADLSAYDLGELKINLATDGKSQEISTDINVNGSALGTVSLKYSDKANGDVQAFSDSEQVYNYTEDGAELQQYLSSANIEGLLKNVSDVIGLDLNSLIGGNPFSGMTNGLIGSSDDSLFPDDSYTNDTPAVTDDIDDDYTMPEAAVYDFSKIKIQVNGKDVTFPAKIDGILDKVNIDVTSIEPNCSEYFYSEDGSISVSVENQSDKAVAPKDCVITGISVSDTSDVKLSIDGIAPGSKISDAVAKYGCKLQDQNSGYTYIDDSAENSYDEITLFYYDGIIYEIDIDTY